MALSGGDFSGNMATKLEETPLNAKIGGKAHSDGTPGTLGEKTSTPQSEALGGPASQQTSEGDAGIDGKESSENLNSDTDGTAGLTAEERAREERVRRNKERMAALGLLDTSRELASTAAAQKRAASGDRGSGRTAKRQRGTVAPKRHSRRVAQEAPELAGLADTRAPSGAASAAVPDLPLDEPIVLRGGLGDLGDAAFLAALRRRGASSEMERLRERAGASLDEYALSPRYVRKIAGTGTPNLSMLPRSDMLAVAAGDMSGRLCLWIADWPSLTHGSSDEGEAEGRRIVEEDGAVAVFTAHRGRVTGLRTWGGGTGAEVLTAGEDGGVRRMELHRGEMEPVWAEEGRELSAMEVGDKGVVFLADKEGNVGAVDWRTKKGLVTDFFKAQSRKINTLSLDADMHTLASGKALGCVWSY